jgi:hypothetical protein
MCGNLALLTTFSVFNSCVIIHYYILPDYNITILIMGYSIVQITELQFYNIANVTGFTPESLATILVFVFQMFYHFLFGWFNLVLPLKEPLEWPR